MLCEIPFRKLLHSSLIVGFDFPHNKIVTYRLNCCVHQLKLFFRVGEILTLCSPKSLHYGFLRSCIHQLDKIRPRQLCDRVAIRQFCKRYEQYYSLGMRTNYLQSLKNLAAAAFLHFADLSGAGFQHKFMLDLSRLLTLHQLNTISAF